MRTPTHDAASAQESPAAGDAPGGPERRALFESEDEAREFVAGSGAAWIGSRSRYFETTDSTNIRARRLADLGWPEGTVVLAEEQTAGRGRLGLRWVCPARAGLLVSVVLPDLGGAKTTWLTAAGALALADAVEAAGGPRMHLMIEWPNDLVVPDPEAQEGRRKLGGILVEARSPGPGLPPTVVLGAGLNVDMGTEEFPPELRAFAGSLVSVFGAAPGRREILGRFLVALEERVAALARETAGTADGLRARSFTLGREVELPARDPGGGARLGRAVDFDEEMRLVVEPPDGGTEAVAFRTSGSQASGQGETA